MSDADPTPADDIELLRRVTLHPGTGQVTGGPSQFHLRDAIDRIEAALEAAEPLTYWVVVCVEKRNGTASGLARTAEGVQEIIDREAKVCDGEHVAFQLGPWAWLPEEDGR